MKTLFKLKPSNKTLNDFYVFDTETGHRKGDKIKYDLFGQPEGFIFGVVYGYNYSKVFYSVDELRNDLDTNPRYKGKKMFAHNAEYDLNTVYGNIYKLDPRAIWNGRFMVATNGNCMFADSMNVFNISVERLGAIMGLEKKSISYNWQKGIKPADVNYCIRDCEIIYEALWQIFEDTGDIKITQASLSMAYYRRYHQPYNIKHSDLNEYFFDSYFGGRTEAFKIGKTNAVVYDINSSYPFAMTKCQFPNVEKLKKERFIKPERFISHYLRLYEGCAEIDVIHKKTKYGFLPYKKDGKLLFPCGKLSGTWNFNELRFAIDNGAIEIKNVKQVIYSLPQETPFSGFIFNLYDKRLKSKNEFEKLRIKVFMNSLYGKFAQRITEESLYLEDIEKQVSEIDQAEKDGVFIRIVPFSIDRSDCFLITERREKFETPFQIPTFSSYITSFARLRVLNMLLKYDRYRPVYCDTDSVFFEIDPCLESSKKLGAWSKEEKIVTHIHGLKNYEYIENDKILRKIKGVPKKAEKINENTYKYVNLVKTKEALRRKLKPGIKIERVKEIKNTYDKRIVKENGDTELIEIK